MKTIKIRGIELGAGVPKTIVSIAAKTKADILAKADEIARLPVDLAEWRADFYEDLFNTRRLLDTLKELRGVLKDTPILFTIRTKPEGGEVKLLYEQYTEINLEAAKSGDADLVDIEVMPKIRADVLDVIDASIEYGRDSDRPFLTISMGSLGMLSRVACEFCGSCMTLGAAGQASAPGQIQVGELKDMLTKIHNAQAGA